MTIYERLGIRGVINGVGTVTRLGGSLMPPPVLEAMLEAARSYVPLPELQAACGQRIAELTHNEACYISSGAAAGLVLATAACITGNDPEKMALLPHPERIPNGKTKVIMHRCQRIGYDFAVRQVGVEIVEVGPSRAEAAAGKQTAEAEMEAAIDERTAAVLYIAGTPHAPGALPLERVVQLAHARGVPVVVDAAAQIPPVENLWRFTGRGHALPAPWAQALAAAGVPEASQPPPETIEPAGADLAIFSGGKGLCGPQSAGLVLGRADLVAAMARQGNPNALIGRPMKVGKEELCGMVAAVEWYLGLDFTALAARYEAQVQHVIDAVAGLKGVVAQRAWPNEAGQPLPRALIHLAPELGLTRDDLQRRLLARDPAIELAGAGQDGVYVNPQTLREGDEVLVADALADILSQVPAAAG